MAKGFWETITFCRFISCHIPVKWPAVQTVFKAGSKVCGQHVGSHSPLLSPKFLLTLNSNVTWLHRETLLSLCTHQRCGSTIPHYLLLSRAADRNALATPAERELGNARNFPSFSPSFFASFHPRGCKWEDFQTRTLEFYVVVLQTHVSCAVLTGHGLWWSSGIAQPGWAWLERVGLHRSVLLIQKK